jgi:hypothetical protein
MAQWHCHGTGRPDYTPIDLALSSAEPDSEPQAATGSEGLEPAAAGLVPGPGYGTGVPLTMPTRRAGHGDSESDLTEARRMYFESLDASVPVPLAVPVTVNCCFHWQCQCFAE